MCSVQNILRLLGEIIADQHCDEEKHPAEVGFEYAYII